MISEREISRRIAQNQRNKLDPVKELLKAEEALTKAHRAFRDSRSKGIASPNAQENYARALREQELCQAVLVNSSGISREVA